MITLGIDTSMNDVSFAIVNNSQILAEFRGDLGRNLVDRISEIFVDLFQKASIKVSDIERCAIVVGPGSFTGLRIGIAFTKGLFACSNVKIIAFSSLECIARSYERIGNICVILDARQGEVFFAGFNNEDGFKRIYDDERIPLETALEKCTKDSNVIYSVDVEKIAGNRGAVIAKIAAESQNLMTIDEVFPNYMQLSYAERQKR
jgi:tRNA threonylcarbamoyladenosine biosynthesis protein TsaB